MQKIMLVLLVTQLLACAMAYGPRFEAVSPAVEQGLIYVYRSPSISGSALSAAPMVLVNGMPAGRLKNGAYVVAGVPPGEVALQLRSTFFGKILNNEIAEKKAIIKAGETRYFEYAAVTTGYERYGDTEVAQVKTVFTPVPSTFAVKRLQKTRLSTYP